MSMRKFFGKYRGKVVNNIDPLGLGRVQVSVQAVLEDTELSWAMPCVPYAGPGVGLFLVPPNDANVWVEFEGGSPDHPIWSGCFWGIGEVPAVPPLADVKVLKTETLEVALNELGLGLSITLGPPAVPLEVSITVDAQGISVSSGPNTVNLTTTALELTHATSSTTLTPSAIETVCGAASVKLSPVSVSINDGALEVI